MVGLVTSAGSKEREIWSYVKGAKGQGLAVHSIA